MKNARNAVRAAATRWVLMLSPGDFLYDSETAALVAGPLAGRRAPRVAFGKQAYFTPGPAAATDAGRDPL